MRIQKNENGQALAEYMPLIPLVLLLSVLLLVPLGNSTGDIFCRMVNAMEPEKCEVVTVEEEEQPVEEPQDDCVPLQEEQGGSQCEQSADCSLLPGSNNGLYNASEPIQTFVIKAGQEYHLYNSGLTNDGCYYVSIDGNRAQWQKVGSGSSCKDISHTQAWKALICQ